MPARDAKSPEDKTPMAVTEERVAMPADALLLLEAAVGATVVAALAETLRKAGGWPTVGVYC